MSKAEPITLFGRLKESMSKVGITVELKEHCYTPLTRILSDLTSSNQTLDIRPDGIFYSQPEVGEQRGYLFPLDGFSSSYPKAHICECSKLKKIRYTLNRRYEWANKSDVYVNVAGSIETVHSLPICTDCLQTLNSAGKKIESTSQYVQMLQDNIADQIFETSQEKCKLSASWLSTRREYLEEVNYTCEECGKIFRNIDQLPFIDVIHENGNVSDNRKINLKCICRDCLRK